MAHSQMQMPLLLQVGDFTGPYALSFAIVWMASSVALLIADFSRPRAEWARQWRPLFAATTMAAAILVYGAVRLPQVERTMANAPAVRVALVQGNVSIKEKVNVSYFDVNLEKYRQLSANVQDDVDLIVWPETVNQHWVSTEATVLEPADNPFRNLRTNLIFGGLAYRQPEPQETEEFNSAFLMAAGGRLLGRYDKRILMPFGEYIPGGSFVPAVYDLSPGTGHFTAGSGVRIFEIESKAGRARVGQLICFEDIVSDMPRHTTQAGAEILATILNDAWYGDTAAPYQHQALALWRSVENRRYLLRGSNSGVTSIIDAAGRVVAQGGLFTAEVVSGAVHRLQIRTVYTRIGDAFAWIIVIATAIVVWRGPGRGKSTTPRDSTPRNPL
jgi:apolipoprotein N-acyltransferase